MVRLGEPRVRECRWLPKAALILFSLTHTPAGALGQARANGPLTWEEGNPLHRLASTPAFESADPVPQGEISVGAWLGWSNIFEQDSSATHVVFLDTERLLSALTVRWGAAERFELGGRITLETTGGGILDSFVHEYHEALSFGQANRDRFPRDGYAQRLTDGNSTEYVDLRQRTLGLADVQLFAKWGVHAAADGSSAVSLRLSARIPHGANRVAEDRADAALVALARLGRGPWFFHAMAGGVAVRAPRELDPVLRDVGVSVGLAVERALGRTVSAIAQYQLATPLLRGFDHRELDWPSSNLVLGAAGRWGESWSWDVSFQEDLPADTPAIDFTLSLTLSRRWR